MTALLTSPARSNVHGAKLEELAARTFDVVVIGGGINGAGIAREAALAGYSVALFEKHDFAWGTTWRSTKLIHGGLRYLEHGEVGLVFESLRDRALLMGEYPGMVRPLQLMLPVYGDDRHGPVAIGLGLTAYDALSFRPGGPRLPRHRRLSREEAGIAAPAMRSHGLRTAFQYWDCQVAYPERLCAETLAEARAAGAETLNHAGVVAPLRAGERIRGVAVRDAFTGRTAEIRSRIVINAAGPWVDGVMRELGTPLRQLGGTKGVHIVVDFGGNAPTTAVYSEARTDHRPFFVIPWRGKHLVGTTDTRFERSPDDVRPLPHEVEYLLHEVESLFPESKLSPKSVLYAYAGVRPLPRSPGNPEGSVTRRHLVRDHTRDGSAGLVSIVGGKLSTYRSLSKLVLGTIKRKLGQRSTSGNARRPSKCPEAGGVERTSAIHAGEPLQDYLSNLYAQSLPAVLGMLDGNQSLSRPLCPHGPDIEGQVVYAARHEQARSLADALLRRTGAGWNSCLGLDAAPRAAELMSAELGWEPERVAAELTSYRHELRATFLSQALPPPPASN